MRPPRFSLFVQRAAAGIPAGFAHDERLIAKTEVLASVFNRSIAGGATAGRLYVHYIRTFECMKVKN
jgi:hypothetical protein